MSSAPSETDYIVSISFQTKPEEDRQTQITAEVSQYLTSRKVQFVIQQDVSSADVAWSLVLLVRIPSTSDQQQPGPKLRSIQQYIQTALKSERLGCFKDHSVNTAKCNAALSRALDRGLCQDQSLDAIPCGPAASGVQAIRSQPQLKSKLGQNSVFQNSNSGMDTAQEKSGDNQDSHSAPSSLSESWDNLMLNPFFRRLPS